MSRYPMDFATLYGMYQQRQAMTQPNFLTQAFANQFGMGNYNNEARYGDIIGGRTAIYDRNMDRINSLGAQEREDINRRADEQLAAQRSSLISRGLGGTTVRESVENRALEDRNRALRQQSDNEVRQRIATDSQLADNVYATMERRNDNVPDLGQLAQLNQAVGASGMYGQYPGMSSGGSVYNRQPPAMVPYGGISGGNGGWGAGARQPVGRPGNRLPGYDNSQGRSIGNMGPNTFQPGGSSYQNFVGNMGPGVGGAGGSAGGYPLPGGGTSTPTYMPQPFPAPGFGGDNGNFGQPGMTLPGGGIISKYRGGDRVGSAIESQLLNRIKGYSGISDRSGNRYGQPQQQSGGMIRTAGDISRTPQQQINDYMQNRMRDNVYGINPNPTFKGMGGPPTFTIGGMPQYLTAQQPIYNYEWEDTDGGGSYTRGRTGARGGMGGVPLSGAVRSGGSSGGKKVDAARMAAMGAAANAPRREREKARISPFDQMGLIPPQNIPTGVPQYPTDVVDVPPLPMPSMPGLPGSQSIGAYDGPSSWQIDPFGYEGGGYAGGSPVPGNPLFPFNRPAPPQASPQRIEEIMEMNRRANPNFFSSSYSAIDEWLYGLGQQQRDNLRGSRPRY